MEDLLQKIKIIDTHFRKVEKPETIRLFERITKLNEEVGELCEAVLCEVDENQRDKQKEIDFDSELADVMICCLMLSTQREKSIYEEIDKKLNKIISKIS